MATRKQLEAYAKNPKVRKFLDLISYTEGTQGNGYHTAFGGGRLSSLNDHPRYLKPFKQTDGKQNTTSAAGRYQFVRKTWDEVARRYGLNDFSPHNQDLGAIAKLIDRKALGAVLKGDWQTAVKQSGGEWASLPSSTYKQNKRSWDNVARFMGGKVPTSQPQQPQFERPQRISIAELQAQEKQFARPNRVPISELQAMEQPNVFQRPERVPISQLQAAEPPLFERPERIPISQLQATEQATSAFERPDRVPIAELQTQFTRPERVPIEQLQGNIESNPMPELEPQQI